MFAPLSVGGRRVPAGLVGALADGTADLADPARLRRRLAEDGYLYLPGLLDAAAVAAARREVFARLHAVGEVRAPPEDGIATGVSRRAGEHDQPVLKPQDVEEVDYAPLVGRKRGDGAFPHLEVVQLIGREAVEQIEAVGACDFQPAQVGPIDQPGRFGGRQVLL